MNASWHASLASSALYRRQSSVFPKITGLDLEILSASGLFACAQDETGQNPFCKILAGTVRGRAICRQARAKMRRCGGSPPRSCEVQCLAGLAELAVPVVVGGTHVATLTAGPVLDRKPTRRTLENVISAFQIAPDHAGWPRAEQAYLQFPVFSGKERAATQQLMTLFAEQLAAVAKSHSVAAANNSWDPACVVHARQYVEAHLSENIRTHQVAQAVHVSLQHFCRVFHHATGETFTDYLARKRVERAKALLANPQMTVGEVGFSTGFGSLTWFDQIFKRHTGQTPRQFRIALKNPRP